MMIIVCERNPILADGICQLLRSDPHLIDIKIKAHSEADFTSIESLGPDILIIDPVQCTDQSYAILATFMSMPKAMALIAYCPDIALAEARVLKRAGFRGIIPKTVTGKELVRCVCSVAFGGTYIHDKYVENIHSGVEPGASFVPPPTDLTDRESAVLRHVALGSSMKEIASVLNISTKTVDTYRSRANQKLNLRSRSDIVRFAIQSGWMN